MYFAGNYYNIIINKQNDYKLSLVKLTKNTQTLNKYQASSILISKYLPGRHSPQIETKTNCPKTLESISQLQHKAILLSVK
jgi:hypothetical protein